MLVQEPPIPPRLIGSPLLEKLMTSPTAPPRSAHDMWIDGDEFSVRKNGHAVLGSAPTQPQGAARYAAYPPPVPASLQPAGAAAHGSPSAKRCVFPAGAYAAVQLTHPARSSRPIAT